MEPVYSGHPWDHSQAIDCAELAYYNYYILMMCDLHFYRDIFSLAIEPADFVALLNSITFSPGDREICQDISILEDTLYEDDESFSALLSTGDSSADIDPSQQSATITIMDTDGK